MKDNINILGLLARKKIGTQLVLGVWRKKSGQMVSLRTTYDETKPFAIPFIYEPIIHVPKFEIFAGVVFMELSVNLVTVMLQSNVAELIRYMKPKNRLKPAVVVAGVLPGSIASLDGSVKPGLIVKKVNGKSIQSMADICAALKGKSAWYTVSTSQTFTAFKAKQVEEYNKSAMAEGTGKGKSFCNSKLKPGASTGSAALPSAAGSAALMQFLGY